MGSKRILKDRLEDRAFAILLEATLKGQDIGYKIAYAKAVAENNRKSQPNKRFRLF